MKSGKIMKYLCCIAIAGTIVSCSKMNATYQHFVKDGLVIYTPRIDSLKAFAGKGRILLTGLISSRVTGYTVHWNNGEDSLVKETNFQTPGIDTLKLMIDNLDEKTYFFDIVTYDQYGHASVPSSAKGKAYSDKYESLLENRAIVSVGTANEGKDAVVDWLTARSGEVGIEVEYVNNADESVAVFVPDSVVQTVLPDFKHGSRMSYRSAYLPEPTAVDTFFCKNSFVDLPVEEELDETKFAAVRLPGDYPICCGWLISHLWDGVLNGSTGFASAVDQFPGGANEQPGNVFMDDYRFTVDLGVKAQLSRYVLWPRLADNNYYNVACPKNWEIWGSNDPDQNGTYEGWVKLLSCTMVKPSGEPVGSNTREDIAAANAGFEFTFPSDVPAVRYIRFRLVGQNWAGTYDTQLTEWKFWGEVVN